MSDWRQIQARIRKARTSADPSGQLATLYERTHDAMVAFELAQIHEKSGVLSEAVRWYTAAAERFRRAQWKQKAEECLTRLGAPIPVSTAAVTLTESTGEPVARFEPMIEEISEDAGSEIMIVSEHNSQPQDSQKNGQEVDQELVAGQSAAVAGSAQSAQIAPGQRRKRRGRRGGRGRNKHPRQGDAVTSSSGPIPISSPSFQRAAETRSEPRSEPRLEPTIAHYVSEEIVELRSRAVEPVSNYEPAVAGSSLRTSARAGDPALSSRMTKLESQLRRLLACSLHSLSQAEEAPAGPGVFLITDTDQTTYYYVEACQTLRVGVGNLLRSGRGSREGAGLKDKLADHLGINEARVGKYLKEHCVARWLQLDEGAPLLAHFAIAVLRPIANE